MFGFPKNNVSPPNSFGFPTGQSKCALDFAQATDIRDFDTRISPQVLMNNLNGYSIAGKEKAVYPFVSDGYIYSRATQHKFNLIDPRDLDAAFAITYSGGWTHGSTGAKPNGTNAYGDTHFNPANEASVTTTNIAISTYLRDNDNGIGDFGNYTSTISGVIDIMARYTGGTDAYYRAMVNGGDITVSGVSDARGLTLVQTNASASRSFVKNGVVLNTNTSATFATENSLNILIGSIQNAGVPFYWSQREHALDTIGNALIPQEQVLLYAIEQSFQSNLNRRVG